MSGFSTNSLVAVILAGGFGTRIQHLTPNLPKPMVPVLGRPFIEWIIRYLGSQGIKRAILSIGFRAESVETHFQSQPVSGVSVRCVREITPLGTAGGFLNAIHTASEIPSAWLVMNGDSLALGSIRPLVHLLDDTTTAGGLVGISVPDAGRFGTLDVGSKGELLGFLEKRSGSGVINAGVYLLRPEIVDLFPNQSPLSFENDVFPSLAAKKVRLKVCITKGPFLDIGTPETLPLAEAFLRQSGIATSNV